MVAIRSVLLIGVAVLSVAIAYASVSADLFASFGQISAMPWGLVSLIDLYLGFVVLAVLIGLVERRGAALGWIVALFVLGNVVGAAWFAWRLPRVWSALRKP